MTESLATRDAVAVVAATLGGYALLSGFVSFLGWPLDIPRLTDWFDDNVSIQPNACVLIALSGAAVVLAQRSAWRTVTALGFVVGIGGALILLQYVIGADFGFNHQLLFGRTWGQGTTLTPGRVGPPASASLALIGAALVILARTGLRPKLSGLRRFVPAAGLTVCGLMAFSLLGYLFGAEEFYTIPWLTAIALPTATMLLAGGIGLILSVPEHDPLRLLRERSGAGALARIAIPALAILIPLVLWFRIEGFERGYYDLGTGRAVGALALVASTIAILWIALLALRRHEQALREADRRKDEFLATLAHELRNPLAPLTNALAILDFAHGDPELAGEARATMSRQLKQLVRLIDDLLDVSRITRGTIQIRKEHVELRSVVEESIEATKPVCAAAEQELRCQMPMQPVWIRADRLRVGQIISNLLSNASRYSAGGTSIELDVSVNGQEVVFRVKDHGIGIGREHLETIFEMFHRVDSSLERAAGGLGIGLYLVRRLAELHGGAVTAHSEGKGKGSEFVVRLPIVVEAPNTSIARSGSAAETAARRLRVLVVDDNVDAAQTMSTLLRAHGYLTRLAHDGLEAVEEALRYKPHVVLLDIGLPKLSGYDVCRRLRQEQDGHAMTIIALTGWGQEQDKMRAAESGFDAHFAKPVEWSALVEVFQSRPVRADERSSFHDERRSADER